ncbi:MAG: cation:proton antiporter [Pikeienuella sp.]
MAEFAVFLAAALLLAVSLLARPVERALLSGPMLFLALGVLLGPLGLGAVDAADHGGAIIAIVAEATLIIVLFEDACLIRMSGMRRDRVAGGLAARLLLVALPLCIIAGALIAAALFPEFLIAEAFVLALILAPTDAALCAPVFNSKKVPEPVKEALNADSGLNDGICLPLLLLALAISTLGLEMQLADRWAEFIGLQLVLGPLTGAFVGWAGAALLKHALQRGWVLEELKGLTMPCLAIIAALAAEMLGGNGFLAAFLGGLVFGNRLSAAQLAPLSRFTRAEGAVLILATFCLFGAVAVAAVLPLLEWRHLWYAIASLTIVRTVPVALSMIGAGMPVATWLFLGWFGPRGVASILYLQLVSETQGFMELGRIGPAVVLTVCLSAVLHGMSAGPATALYARSLGQAADARKAPRRTVS